MDKAIFFGIANPSRYFPLEDILIHFNVIRDAIAGTASIESDDLPTLVANASFVYAFNGFKSISLLLPNLYHESAAAILRQLWEVSLNLHWIGVDPEPRAHDFCGFTVMEYRRLLTISGDSLQLESFDMATDSFQAKFRYMDRRGRKRNHESFAARSIRERAIELDAPWKDEYDIMYNMTSLHAHGAPSAIIRGIFVAQCSNQHIREREATALIAVLAIRLMVRNIELLGRLGIVPETTNILNAYRGLEETLSRAT